MYLAQNLTGRYMPENTTFPIKSTTYPVDSRNTVIHQLGGRWLG